MALYFDMLKEWSRELDKTRAPFESDDAWQSANRDSVAPKEDGFQQEQSIEQFEPA
jgi:hypothetical protein